MFGKTKDHGETRTREELDDTIGEIFGDEHQAAETVRVDELHARVTGVEQQINSQFTSLAAYAQIAQEQVELVRAEASHGVERSEQKLIGLIERERADRIGAGGAGIDVTERLDAIESQIADIRDGLQQCLSNQKALADAILDLFPPAGPVDMPPPPPKMAPPSSAPAAEMPPPMTTDASDGVTSPDPEPAATSDDGEAQHDEHMEAPEIALHSFDEPDHDDDHVTTEIPVVPMSDHGLADGPIGGLSIR